MTLAELIAKRDANRQEMAEVGRRFGEAVRTYGFLREGDNVACYLRAEVNG